jgi:hypothetical protein
MAKARFDGTVVICHRNGSKLLILAGFDPKWDLNRLKINARAAPVSEGMGTPRASANHFRCRRCTSCQRGTLLSRQAAASFLKGRVVEKPLRFGSLAWD